MSRSIAVQGNIKWLYGMIITRCISVFTKLTDERTYPDSGGFGSLHIPRKIPKQIQDFQVPISRGIALAYLYEYTKFAWHLFTIKFNGEFRDKQVSYYVKQRGERHRKK